MPDSLSKGYSPTSMGEVPPHPGHGDDGKTAEQSATDAISMAVAKRHESTAPAGSAKDKVPTAAVNAAAAETHKRAVEYAKKNNLPLPEEPK